jgi:hypothetical protein
MEIAFTQAAAPGEVFAPDAFAGQIGKDIPVRLAGGVVMCRVTGADIAPDGQSVELHLDVDFLRRAYGRGPFAMRWR